MKKIFDVGTILILVSVILMILKLTNVINITWLSVFMPVLIPWGVLIIGFLFWVFTLSIYENIKTLRNGNKRN